MDAHPLLRGDADLPITIVVDAHLMRLRADDMRPHLLAGRIVFRDTFISIVYGAGLEQEVAQVDVVGLLYNESLKSVNALVDPLMNHNEEHVCSLEFAHDSKARILICSASIEGHRGSRHLRRMGVMTVVPS